MTVNAYLLPETFDNQLTTRKSFSPKKIVWGMEVDLTGSGNPYTTSKLYNEYSDLIDFMTIRGAQQTIIVNENTIKLINVKLPICPPELTATFNETNWFRVYINGVLISYQKYVYSYNPTTNEIFFTFDLELLEYIIESTDEISVTGKFIEI
jgi:hypothetical protein